MDQQPEHGGGVSLTFDPIAHVYKVDGRQVPNVTSVLDAAGLNEFGFVGPEVLTFARSRGQAVHAATALDDLGELDEASVDPHAAPYLTAWRRFRRETGFVPTAIEQRVYHVGHRYAGTLDREGVFPQFKSDALLDIKTGAPSATTGPQTAAYLAARGGRRARYAVYLQPDGRYHLHLHKDPNDLAVFLAALTIFNWRNNHA